MIDEFTLEYKTQREWEWLAILDFFLAGSGAGLFLLGLFLKVGIAMVIGIIASGLGSLALLVDLGRPERFLRAILRPLTSWISRGVIILSAFLIFGALHAAPTMAWFEWLPWQAESGFGAVAGVIAGIAAVGVMAYTGFLLAYSPAIPSWHNSLVPMMFVVYSLLTATGVLYLLLPTLDEKAVNLQLWVSLGLILMLVTFLLMLAYTLSLYSSTLAARQAIHELTKGHLALAFVGGVTMVGLILPLAVVAFVYLSEAARALAIPLLSITGFLLIIGGFLIRYCLLKAGIYQPII